MCLIRSCPRIKSAKISLLKIYQSRLPVSGRMTRKWNPKATIPLELHQDLQSKTVTHSRIFEISEKRSNYLNRASKPPASSPPSAASKNKTPISSLGILNRSSSPKTWYPISQQTKKSSPAKSKRNSATPNLERLRALQTPCR